MEYCITEFVGMDIGDKYCHICIIDEDGEVTENSRIRTNEKGIANYFSQRSRMRVVMEVGTHSPWISRLVDKLGHEIFVANARKLKLISGNTKKTDKVDPELLARLGRSDPKLLFPIQHRKEAAQKDLAVVRSRAALVRTRSSLINHVRGIVKSAGYRLPSCSAESFHKLMDTIPENLTDSVEPVMKSIALLTTTIRTLDRTIETLSKTKYPETKHLRTIPGVGPITALTFVLTLEDPHRFNKNRSIGAYLGLCPRKAQSGKKDPELRITKAGDRYLRTLLVSCANYILGPFGPDSYLKRFGDRLTERGGKWAKKRAVVAVARKLAVLLVRLWKTGDVYDPFYPNSHIITEQKHQAA